MEYLPLAKAHAIEWPYALGTILLASLYQSMSKLQRIFPLQIHCKPIQICFKSLLTTDLQQKCSIAKNLVAILHTLAFGCKSPTDLQQNYSVVILQRLSHSLLIQLLNPKN